MVFSILWYHTNFWFIGIFSLFPSLLKEKEKNQMFWWYCITNPSPFHSLSSQGNYTELPESDHWLVPRQNMLRLQRGQGPGLLVLRCQCLGPGSGLPVGIQNTLAFINLSTWLHGAAFLNNITSEKYLHCWSMPFHTFELPHFSLMSVKSLFWNVKFTLFFKNIAKDICWKEQ